MKYPIGIQTVEQIRADGYVHIGKTDMVYSRAHEDKSKQMGEVLSAQ